MPEFFVRSSAIHSPTKCAFCGDFEGPFIDTNVDLVGYGRLWVCMSNHRRSGCVRQMARFDGMFDESERDDLLHNIEKLGSQNGELQEALAAKKLPVGQVLELLGR